MDFRLVLWGGTLGLLVLLAFVGLLFDFRPEFVRGLLFATILVAIGLDPTRPRRARRPSRLRRHNRR